MVAGEGWCSTFANLDVGLSTMVTASVDVGIGIGIGEGVGALLLGSCCHLALHHDRYSSIILCGICVEYIDYDNAQ